MEMLSLLKELKEIVNSSIKMPLTGKVLVDQDEILEIIDDLYRIIPEEIQKAEEIKKEREIIIAQAHEKAERLVLETKKYVSRMAQENEIVQQAQDEAIEIVKQAKTVAQEIQTGANAYADDLLSGLENNLLKTGETLQEALMMIREGRDELKKK